MLLFVDQCPCCLVAVVICVFCFFAIVALIFVVSVVVVVSLFSLLLSRILTFYVYIYIVLGFVTPHGEAGITLTLIFLWSHACANQKEFYAHFPSFPTFSQGVFIPWKLETRETCVLQTILGV